MINKDFFAALDDLEREKGIDKSVFVAALENALSFACKKNFGEAMNVELKLNPEKGGIEVCAYKNIVETVEDPEKEISLEEAREIKKSYKVGDRVVTKIAPKEFGRIAAQTAKQVVMQRIREAEQGAIFEEYSDKEYEVLTAIVQRVEKNGVYVELGKTDGIIPFNEVIVGENYAPNDHIKVYVLKIQRDTKGPQIIVSRTHPGLVKRLFELEVPEIQSGVVQIKSVAREAGQRTKIAVASFDPQVDAVGACVGQRGTRVENIVNELHNEKMDIIEWDPDIAVYIAKALGPAKVLMVYINEAEKAAKVIVPDNQLSLAIGKEGQNARLAAKLTGWKIDIKSHSQAEADMELEMGSVDGGPGSESGNDMFNDDEAFGEQGFNGAPMNFDDFGGQNI